LFICATQRYNQKYGTQLDDQIFTSPHISFSSVAQCKQQPVNLKTNRVVVSPMLEVVKWKSDEYIGVELDEIYSVKALEANFGVKECVKWLQLETSVDGENWETIPMSQEKNILKATLGGKARYVRILNRSGQEQEVYLRRFIEILEPVK
jgi:hyaluronoglucosaminidase